ncbi:DUF5134 domain-containing protein [Brevibacterium aurantiacum]|uniref:DUF5134 domain-containing protein n=2 Tax=Brevibacterium aurantiacum TaxID=273384 RepID=A0A2H1KPC8_BREAU|nr:DUF5134 domain-containing protein [Brevibacterium aurantiacum]RCS97532.1 DUF5134 domain-containing protein [Brevibacterium aurantiacum]SMY01663.1 hypothetical protein BAURA86_03092 [Brevibacterium aurantiacum]SMY02731.1 hypothetical protein BAURA63_03689 [Brevibacterium aurantiacum]
MISFPWSLTLTAAFAFTGFVCLIHIVQHWSETRSRTCPDVGAARMDLVVHSNHLVMSIGMIAMVWANTGTIATWGQSVFFTALAAVMAIGLLRTPGRDLRISLASHLALNAAMVWMLLAMPLLMAHPMGTGAHGDGSADGGGHDSGHHGDHSMAHGMPLSQTPDWATAVNWVAIALSALAAAWWLILLVRSCRIGIHTLCHAVMGLGMAGMLALM